MKTISKLHKGFKLIHSIILVSFLLMVSGLDLSAQQPKMTTVAPVKKWVLVVHGGAGSAGLNKGNDARSKAAWQKIKEALDAGATILRNNGTSLDAVETVIKMLED